MCGRFSSTLSAEFIRRLFGTESDIPNLGPSWNLAPSQDALVVRRHPETGARRLDALKWGLVPHFTNDLKEARKPINARAETVATSGMFRGAFAARRCIACRPASSTSARKSAPPSSPMQSPGPMRRRSPSAVPGKAGDRGTARSFAPSRSSPPPPTHEMSEVHDRMPLVLEEADWRLWLGEDAGDPARLLRPAPDGTPRAWPVSPRVNSPRNNDASLIEPMRMAAEFIRG
jgi:putative SOS response-associated peptidase YedK